MECGTITQLASHFETRFDVLKTAFKLHVCVGKDVEELEEMKTNVLEIQQVLKQLRATMDREVEDLRYAKEVRMSLQTERCRVEHMLANLPDRLPCSGPAPPSAAAQSHKGSGSEPQRDTTARPHAAAAVATPTAPSIACLTVAEFEAVPQYMRGRTSRDQANRLLDQVNAALAGRHALVRRPRSAVAGKQKKLWLECRREETTETKGLHFFTEDDLQRFNKTSISKTVRQLLVILRHSGRTKLVRGPGTVVRHVLI